MRLLISVADAAEARLALEGDADIIDVKDPARGSLGAADVSVLREIAEVVGAARPISAALGDAADERAIETAARAAATARLAYVKVGFAGVADAAKIESLIAAAVSGVRSVSAASGVVAVAYADATRVDSVSPDRVIEAAERARAVGVLLDTARKDGGALFDLMDQVRVGRWVRLAHEAALTVALAGSLTAADLASARALGADIAGVRGAACEGGRVGRISGERVAALVRANRPMSWTRPFTWGDQGRSVEQPGSIA
ncbi:MAG TPA: (5-formylfuran-3-yl)methyl phosphate synthase [Gemmatimonadaceae bacterium]|nr:(5-formylfuran-3-yl)methyl phosphate synthase [Gemmatimonadaceae bacterium]